MRVTIHGIVLSKNNSFIETSMASFSPAFFFFVSFIIVNLAATTKAQDLTYIYHNCSSNITTANSTFQLELKTLLSSLTSKATNNTEFYNTTVAGRNPSDRAYGEFMCRGDVPSELCGQCVGNATRRLTKVHTECFLSQEAVVWFDECMVRYSNRYFFSTVATGPGYDLPNNVNVSSKTKFKRLLFDIMNKTADEAASSPVGAKKYAAKEANVSMYMTIYSLAQCTPDLSSQDCRTCLRGLIERDLPRCCAEMQGGKILCPSCNIRFETYLFFRSPAATPPGVVPGTNSTNLGGNKNGRARAIVLIAVPFVVTAMLFSFCCYLLRRKARGSYKTILKENFGQESSALEPLQFNLGIIEAATNNFSPQNKIGRGGFGEVYKGMLCDGRHIAVKRLSKSSKQGVTEFKNEVLLIAKLQHKNLVAFIGFCLDEREKILVYEYVANKSLDYLLFGLTLLYTLCFSMHCYILKNGHYKACFTYFFHLKYFVDTQQQKCLSWFERYKIIGGIARGILYLHEYSRLKIIHRDLKPSNILLDENMNPKISDFGLARIIELDQDQESTNRIVGTYGYMSPEYAMLGQFSEKSDVFSFGVIVLEIITGKKNASSYESHRVVEGLLNYVWRHWRDQTPLSILDSNMKGDYSQIEVIKCILIGLLCVQENSDTRPTMMTVVSYLSSHSMEMPSPQEPAFFGHSREDPNIVLAQQSSSSHSVNSSTPLSINEITISKFHPR